jgi:transcriptional regulator with XRE-family HTH domain
MTKEHEQEKQDTLQTSPIDKHVGMRIRLRRNLCGMSQEALGRKLGLTFQQVQKYERGLNRVSASRLYEIARLFDVPISYFFDDMPPSVSLAPVSGPRGRMAAVGEAFTPDLEIERLDLGGRESVELLRAYSGISGTAVRRRVLDLVKSLGELGARSPKLGAA